MSDLAWGYAVCALASAGLTWVTRKYALRRGMIDAPGARRSHVVPTPRGGGLAIVLVVLGACCAAGLIWPAHRPALVLSVAGLVLVAGIGWVDDHRALSPWPRLLVHVLAGALLGAGLCLEGLAWWQAIAGALMCVALVNIWNFMDGINGLVASQALIGSLGFAWVLVAPWSWLAACFCAALFGFLPFNFPRARIFLGDVGSGALGYTLAGLAAMALAQNPGSPCLVLLPLGVCCIDAGFTLARRVLAREAWWRPHTTHAYQRAARRWGHSPVTLACAALTATATMLMVMTWGSDIVLATGVAVVFCVLASSLWWLQLARDFPTDEEH